mgnify:CR=1 FL=1
MLGLRIEDGAADGFGRLATKAPALHDHPEHTHVGEAAAKDAALAPAPDIAGSSATSSSIASNGLLYSRIGSAGDHDWIKITLAAGQQVTFLLSGFGDDGLVDPYLYLRNSAGVLIAENDDRVAGTDRDSRLEFTAASAGTYYIDVGAYGEAYVGDYQLQVFNSRSTLDTIAASTATNAGMSFGGSFNGVLESGGDRDWVAITLVAGQNYVFDVTGDGARALANPQLALRSASGALLVQNDNTNGLNPQIAFTATTGGTYFLDVGSSGGSGSGEYSISAQAPLSVFTYDQIAVQLTETYWGDGRHAFVVGSDRALTVNLTAIAADAQALARAALASWTGVSGIAFVETPGVAEITFQSSEAGAFAYSERSSTGAILSAVVNISPQWLLDYGNTVGTYSYQTYLHEIGHALGLGHAGNYNGSADYATDAAYANDCWSTTVMSYFSQSRNTYFADQGFSFAFLGTPMNGDVVAINALYGLGSKARGGNTVYGFNATAGDPVFDAVANPGIGYCIVDSGGTDILDYSGFTQNQLIDLHAETFMNIGGRTGTVMIARGTVIEQAVGGAGADTMIGNAAGNKLTGNAGNDSLFGFEGADQLFGGDGDDTLVGGIGADRLFGSAGNDTLLGEADADYLDGGLGNDSLDGAAGNDRLYGKEGDDTLRGGSEDDTLDGSSGADVLAGDGGNDRLLGGSGNDRVQGGDGIDQLFGGSGLDTLFGGAGADRFYFDSTPGSTNADSIADFDPLLDLILLRASNYTALGAGVLAQSAFHLGSAAGDGLDRIIYDQATGMIYYDPDGTGTASQKAIAQVTAGTVLGYEDFQVYTTAASAPLLPDIF